MARLNRQRISELEGSYHIISRTVGQEFLFGDEEKDYFLDLLEVCSKSFFIKIHTFCIMDNHFHLLVTSLDSEIEKASKESLLIRYKSLYGKDYSLDGLDNEEQTLEIEKLRKRFGDISKFVQELKQKFSRWYNLKYKRKGYLWADRYKGVLVSKGEAQLAVSAYIDLNPVRAGIVEKPEDYKWSGFYLESRFDATADNEGVFTNRIDTISLYGDLSFEDYKNYVYEIAGIHENSLKNKQCLKLNERIKNFSNGLIVGTKELVERVQNEMNRKFIKARELFEGSELYSTRVLKFSYG